MADGPVDGGPEVPDSARETGVQRALGERRRRRLAERSGQVDLDATMSHWPVVDPPAGPRPVVRPARPSVSGVALAPVLPTPGTLVVGPLLEARRAGGEVERRSGNRPDDATGRRSRRRADDAAASAAAVAAGAPTTIVPGSGHPPQGPGGSRTAEPWTVDGGSQGPAGPPEEPGNGPDAGAEPEPDWEADLVRAADPSSRTRRRPGAGTGPGAAPGPWTPTPTPTVAREAHGATVLGGPARRRRLAWPAGRNGLLLAAGLLLLLLLLVLLLVRLIGGDDSAGAVAPVDGAPAQQTLAVTLSDPGSGVAAAAVLGVDSAQVSTLLLPPELLLTVADAGEIPLEQAVALGADSVSRGLEDTLLLRVDETVLLEPAQLGAMVDAVGGIVVDVADEVSTDDVVIAAGDDQRLIGAQAVAYAGLEVEGEPTEARLARFGDVLGALLAALPTDPEEAAAVLAEAEVGADGSEQEALGAVVAAAAERSAAGNTQATVLPTRELSAGGARLRGVDEEAAREQLSGRFAGALLPVAAVGEVRVVVRNGVGTGGLVGQARDRLVAAGLRYAGGGNAPAFGEEATVVLIASQEDADRDQGQAVAEALGVGADALQVNSEAMVDTDVVVVLGDDFAAQVSDDPSASTEPTSGDNP